MKLRILANAELKLAHLKARRLFNRTILCAIALGLLLLTVLMVNVGAYQLLIETYTESASAFLVGAGNAVLAVLFAFAVKRVQAGPDEQMAQEIRDMALDELTADLDELKQELDTDVKRLRTGFSILNKGSQIGAGLASVAPVIATIVDAIRQHRKEKKSQAEQQAPE
ncbi:MAG: hypothetical protein GTO41_06330 [Burkholderiales bacterium]|nr:hypothetical protein [Burkholderiales bacterium]